MTQDTMFAELDKRREMIQRQSAEIDRLTAENEKLRAAWLKRIKIENDCQKYLAPRPCRFEKCACLLEMESYIGDEQIVGPK
jgi:hypothetical protein